MIKGQWDLDVVAGSTLPRSRDARQRTAVELYKLKLFDKEQALRWMELPGTEKLLLRLKEEEQRRTELLLEGVDLEGGGGGAGGGPGGPPPLRRPQVSTRGGGFNNQPGNV